MSTNKPQFPPSGRGGLRKPGAGAPTNAPPTHPQPSASSAPPARPASSTDGSTSQPMDLDAADTKDTLDQPARPAPQSQQSSSLAPSASNTASQPHSDLSASMGSQDRAPKKAKTGGQFTNTPSSGTSGPPPTITKKRKRSVYEGPDDQSAAASPAQSQQSSSLAPSASTDASRPDTSDKPTPMAVDLDNNNGTNTLSLSHSSTPVQQSHNQTHSPSQPHSDRPRLSDNNANDTSATSSAGAPALSISSLSNQQGQGSKQSSLAPFSSPVHPSPHHGNAPPGLYFLHGTPKPQLSSHSPNIPSAHSSPVPAPSSKPGSAPSSHSSSSNSSNQKSNTQLEIVDNQIKQSVKAAQDAKRYHEQAQQFLNKPIFNILGTVRITYLRIEDITRDKEILIDRQLKEDGSGKMEYIKYAKLKKSKTWKRTTPGDPITWFPSKDELANPPNNTSSGDSKNAHDVPDDNAKPNTGKRTIHDMANQDSPSPGYCGMHGGHCECQPTDHVYPACLIRDNQFALINLLNKKDRTPDEERFVKKLQDLDGYHDLFKRLNDKDDKDGKIYGTLLFFRLYYNDESNLASICTDCNTKKSNIPPEDWFAAQKTLFPNFLLTVNLTEQNGPLPLIKRMKIKNDNNQEVEIGLGDAFRSHVQFTQHDSRYSNVMDLLHKYIQDQSNKALAIPKLASEGRPGEAQIAADRQIATLNFTIGVQQIVERQSVSGSPPSPTTLNLAGANTLARLESILREELQNAYNIRHPSSSALSNSTSQPVQQHSQTKPSTG